MATSPIFKDQHYAILEKAFKIARDRSETEEELVGVMLGATIVAIALSQDNPEFDKMAFFDAFDFESYRDEKLIGAK